MATHFPINDTPINQWRTVQDGKRLIFVQRYNIIGSDTSVFAAYTPAPLFGPFSCTTSGPEGQSLGQLGSERLTPELDALPAYSEERIEAVQTFHHANCAAAHRFIVEAFPEAGQGRIRPDGMDINMHVPGVAHQARVENWARCSDEYRAQQQVWGYACHTCGRSLRTKRASRCNNCRRFGLVA